MKLKVTIFLFLSLCHLGIAIQCILKMSPHLGPLAILSKDIWTYFYIIIGIIGISIKLIYKIRYNWVVYLSACITILYCLSILTLHSPYYHNADTLSIDINLRDINPITYYEDLGQYPPPINSLYVIMSYNIIVFLLTYFIHKKTISKMKRLTTFIAATLFSAAIFAQKAAIKKDEILSDGNPIAKIEKDGCGALSPTCNFQFLFRK